MSADTQVNSLVGLDNLELAPQPGREFLRGTSVKVLGGLWPKVLAIVIVLGLWELVYVANVKPHDIFPGPATVLPNLWTQANHSLLWQAIGTTLRRAVTGFALALVIGSIVGALVSRIKVLRAAVGSLITGLQTMPSIAWFPFAIIFFGLNTSAILFVIVLGAAPSIANGLIAGVDYTPPVLLRAGKTMGLRGLALYRHLILPASLPTFVAGLKQGWAFAWRSLMAGELLVIIAGTSSIGVLLSNDQNQADMPSAMAIMIVILVLGIGVDALFGTVDRTIRRRRGLADPAVGR
ncbi:MAG TPA: ABC transporter permease [Streptosporangiaceae bacterium]|jgi:NitT/TauT family transport system permease protein|nr:ABC transporter permease [Streptosporangiaceae bacterium]